MSREGRAVSQLTGELARRLDERRLMSFALLALGLVSIALLLGTDRIRQRTIMADTALVKAIGEIQTRVAISHLWLEEYVTGDAVDVNEIDSHLDRALALTQAMQAAPGKGRDRKLLADLALDAPDLRRQVAALALQLEEFRRISAERQTGFAAGKPVAVGSPIDVAYDGVFVELLRQAVQLEEAIEVRMARRRENSRRILLGIVAAWATIVIAAVVGQWSLEQRRRQAEAALTASQLQLVHSQKMEAVGRLAGGLAHDLNNYLAAIRGHCELARMKPAPEERVIRKMDAAIRSLQKASALIARLLAFNRKLPSFSAVVDLNQTVDGLEKMMQQLIGDDVRLETRLASDLHAVKIDPSELEQVIVNLLVNARDAMPTGGTVTITTANCRSSPGVAGPGASAANADVLLEVSDSGAGIPAEIRDKIFEPFFTTKEDRGSSGLGLATVYGIVSRHGGRIEVASEVGRGTRFRVLFPASDEPATLPESSSSAFGAGELCGHERILLVDDNDDFREATQPLLEALGYHITPAASAEAALALFARPGFAVDLVLTDVVMPGLGGRELADRLRRQEPNLKVLFLSGYTNQVTRNHGVDHADGAFLDKTCAPRELALRIRELLAAPVGEKPAPG